LLPIALILRRADGPITKEACVRTSVTFLSILRDGALRLLRVRIDAV
jgi:hypothetical protein